MAIAGGVTVANLYYNQPLLADIAREFHVDAALAGWLPMATQIGYALGMLLIVPLGDSTERRRLIVVMIFAAILALCWVALAHSFAVLLIASCATGCASCVPQLLTPFAAHLAGPAGRGRAVGFVMSGLLIGILLARTVSGTVGAHLGWRAMYWIAAVLMVVLAIVLRKLLPRSEPEGKMTYGELMRSIGTLARTQPVLREAAFSGGMLFACFSAFWATLVFRLEQPPYHYGSQVAGLFGLVGVVGATAAPLAGKISDVGNPRSTVRVATIFAIISYAQMWLFGAHLWSLVLGVILLDACVQGGHVSNQSRIYALHGDALNRVNTVYMVTYFAGGAIGSSLGTWGWQHWHWSGVCAVAIAFLVLGGIAVGRNQK